MGLGEVDDVAAELIAGSRPAGGAAQVLDGVAQAMEEQLVAAAAGGLFEPVAQDAEELELVSVGGEFGDLHERNFNGRRLAVKLGGDVAPAHVAEDACDFVVELIDGDESTGKALAQVFDDGFGNIVGEPPVLVAGFLGGFKNGVGEPAGFILHHFVDAVCQERQLVGEADHQLVFFEEVFLTYFHQRDFFERLDGVDEFSDFLEVPVNGCVADKGDAVYFFQLLHDDGADDFCRDFAQVLVLQLDSDFFDCVLEGFDTDGALFAGFDHAAQELLRIEGFAGAVGLYHLEVGSLDLLIGGEAMPAGKALRTASNRAAIFGRARVDDLVFDVSAFGAAHNFFEREVGGVASLAMLLRYLVSSMGKIHKMLLFFGFGVGFEIRRIDW